MIELGLESNFLIFCIFCGIFGVLDISYMRYLYVFILLNVILRFFFRRVLG